MVRQRPLRIFNGEAEGGSVDLDEALEITGLQEPRLKSDGVEFKRKKLGRVFLLSRGMRVSGVCLGKLAEV